MANPTVGTQAPYYGQPVNIGTYYNVTATSGGEAVKSTDGVLYSITFNNPVATTVITLYDGTSTSGTKIGTITVPSSPMPVTLYYNVYFSVGLFISVATAASDFTINYK